MTPDCFKLTAFPFGDLHMHESMSRQNVHIYMGQIVTLMYSKTCEVIIIQIYESYNQCQQHRASLISEQLQSCHTDTNNVTSAPHKSIELKVFQAAREAQSNGPPTPCYSSLLHISQTWEGILRSSFTAKFHGEGSAWEHPF